MEKRINSICRRDARLGFTITELLVVIGIIVLLVGIVTFVVGKSRRNAMTMRVRGARGPIDVDLREEDGALSLRIAGDDALAERVRDDLAARGIEIEIR